MISKLPDAVCAANICFVKYGCSGSQKSPRGEKHKTLLTNNKSPSLFFKHIAANKTCSKPSKEGVSSQQTTLDLVVHAKEELQTEIRWFIAAVMYNLSSNAASNMTQLFSSLFPDSKVAKDVTLGRTKISYIMNFGLAPYFKSLLTEEIKKNSMLHYFI